MESKQVAKVEGLNDNEKTKDKRVKCGGVAISRPQQ
jgi:hypothetical protein